MKKILLATVLSLISISAISTENPFQITKGGLMCTDSASAGAYLTSENWKIIRVGFSTPRFIENVTTMSSEQWYGFIMQRGEDFTIIVMSPDRAVSCVVETIINTIPQ